MKKLLFLLTAFFLVLSCSSDETSTPVTPPPAPIVKYTITLSAGEGGTVSTTGGEYEAGQTVSVTAIPQGEYVFTSWSDGNTNATRTITISSNSTLTANFEKRKYPLTINFEGEGEVLEEIVNTGRTTDYDSGTTVKLTSIPAEGWVFKGWDVDINGDVNPQQILVTEPKTVLAIFIKDSSSFIPIMYLNTGGIEINSKEDYVLGTLSISGGEEFPDLSITEMKIRGRGNSTWWQGGIWGKKPFQIKFENKTEILRMPKDKKWVLLAEISDISLIRNKLSRELANISRFDYVPQSKYIELFINNEYAGVYLVGQKVEESSSRVNIGKDGYLVEIDTNKDGRIKEEDVYFRSNVWSSYYGESVFNIKEPNIDYNNAEFDLIKNHINLFESALFGEEFKDPDLGYRSYIDIPSFIDWYLVNEIAKNQDAQRYSSIFFNYIPGEKIKMGPIWDFDLAFGNVDYSSANDSEGFWIKDNLWYKRMFEDPYFIDLARERLGHYYNHLNELLLKIDSYQEYLAKGQQKNFALYPGLLDPAVYVWPVPYRFDNYNAYVQQLKLWLEDRMIWLKASL